MNSGLQVYNSVQYKMSHDDESNYVSFVWCAIEYTSARATYFISFPNDHPVVLPHGPRVEVVEDNLDRQSVGSVMILRAMEEAKLAGLKAKSIALKKKT